MGVEFDSSDGAAWEHQLEGYASLLQALSKPNLQELDQFYMRTLPNLLQERQPSPFITAQELAKVVQWKLSRGKWRPKLLSYAQSLAEEDVKKASMASFSALPDLKAAISALSALKGVGPATASAVLAVAAPQIAPFMSDEAMIAVLGGVKDYTLRQYLLFADKLQRKAQELTKSNDKPFMVSDLERALWCAALEKRFPKAVEKEVDEHKDGKDPSVKDSNKKRKKRG